MESKKQSLSLDVKGALASKNPKLAKYTPSFIISFLKKLIHQDEMNFLLHNNASKTGVDFASGILYDMNVKENIKFVNKESINLKGRYIFVSNHPLGGLDGMILISKLGELLDNNIKFVVNDLLMNIKPLEPIFVPVNKHGSMNKDYGNAISDAFASDANILYFPAGLCSRLIHNEIVDLEWKNSFLKQAIKYNRDIVPIYFGGKNSNRFYKIANIRKKLGLKFNIEMILLPKEMMLQKNRIFDVVIGTPIPIEKLIEERNNGKSLNAICKQIRELSYNLKKYLNNE